MILCKNRVAQLYARSNWYFMQVDAYVINLIEFYLQKAPCYFYARQTKQVPRELLRGSGRLSSESGQI